MSVLKSKRTESKAEYVNVANAIYIETINFLTRISARYSRLIAEPVAKLAGELFETNRKIFHNFVHFYIFLAAYGKIGYHSCQ